MYRFACLGDNCVDCYDETNERYPGGNPVNVAVYFKRLGSEASYIGAVGTDADGELITGSLTNKGVDVSHVKVLPGTTAITHVRRVNGERVFGEDDPGVMEDLRLDATDLDFIAEHDMVVTGLWGYCEEYLAELKTRGIPVAYDASDKPDLPQCEVGIPAADYVFFSDDVSDEESILATMRSIVNKGPATVIAMRGGLGSIGMEVREVATGGNPADRASAQREEHIVRQGIVDCPVVDTMGAGDSFIAGFLNARMAGGNLEECMAKGAENSAVTIGYRGAW